MKVALRHSNTEIKRIKTAQKLAYVRKNFFRIHRSKTFLYIWTSLEFYLKLIHFYHYLHSICLIYFWNKKSSEVAPNHVSFALLCRLSPFWRLRIWWSNSHCCACKKKTGVYVYQKICGSCRMWNLVMLRNRWGFEIRQNVNFGGSAQLMQFLPGQIF